MRSARRARRGVVMLLIALLSANAAWAQIYSGNSSESGAIVLSNFASAEAPHLLVAAPEAPRAAVTVEPGATSVKTGAAIKAKPNADLRRLIDSVASRTKLPAELLHAVIAVESGYDAKARSPKGAMGLMQLMPATAQRFGVRDPFAPVDNVQGGASYLKWLLDLFEGDLELALAAYNSGEQAVLKAGRRIPPFPETQAYVPRVLAYLPNAPKLLR
jgi:soluble lytic murein transglycosylase-like protein